MLLTLLLVSELNPSYSGQPSHVATRDLKGDEKTNATTCPESWKSM